MCVSEGEREEREYLDVRDNGIVSRSETETDSEIICSERVCE